MIGRMKSMMMTPAGTPTAMMAKKGACQSQWLVRYSPAGARAPGSRQRRWKSPHHPAPHFQRKEVRGDGQYYGANHPAKQSGNDARQQKERVRGG